MRLLNLLCSCSFTCPLIGQAIALQRLRENCLLSMIPKSNRLMRAEFNVHSVAQLWHSKRKAITISQTGMNTKRNAPSELSPAPSILLADYDLGDLCQVSILSLFLASFRELLLPLLPQKTPLSLQNLFLRVAHKASNVIARNLKRLLNIPKDPPSAQELNHTCRLRKQPLLLGCYYFRSSLLLEASGRV